jgi:CTP synthase
MRLGAYPCQLVEGSFAMDAYRKEAISERHRHRYEFNNEYKEKLEAAGLMISGTSPEGDLVEIVELKDHPWFLGCQFHPESRKQSWDIYYSALDANYASDYDEEHDGAGLIANFFQFQTR